MAITKGDFIKISYTGRIEDGSVFDTTDETSAKEAGIFDARMSYKPILLVVGKQHAIRGLDEAVEGMAAGQEKEVNVPQEKGFGPRISDLISVVSMSQFEKQNVNPTPGMIVNVNDRDGMVKSVGAGRVIVDFNHPLAGKSLKYNLKVIEVLESDAQKVKAIFDDTGLAGTVSMDTDTVVVGTKADPTSDYIYRKQTFLSWMREIKGVKKIKFTEEYEISEKDKGEAGHDHDHEGHNHEGHDHAREEPNPKGSRPKK